MDLEELAAPARSTGRPSAVALFQASTLRLDPEVRIEKKDGGEGDKSDKELLSWVGPTHVFYLGTLTLTAANTTYDRSETQHCDRKVRCP
jgi:hypothetical protein